MTTSGTRPSTIIAVVMTSATIAALAPFDVAFAAATMGSPILRIALMSLISLAGVLFAKRCGLRLDGHGAKYPALVGVVAAFFVAAYVIALDAFIFRHLLSAEYVRFLHIPLFDRLVYFMLRAFNENVIYRLFVFSGLLYLSGRYRKSLAVMFAAMVSSQLINIGMNTVLASAEPASVTVICYDALRYVAPGVFWAWLFLRFGFVVAEIASVGCHIFLQPAFGVFI